MAKYRQIHTKIWKDAWFLELKPVHKLFFIYLFSNERASISGIYELPLKVMSFESGLDKDEIIEAFEMFSAAQKAYYQDGVVWVPNLRKYHETTSPKVQTAITNDIADVKECELKNSYLSFYGIDRVSDTLPDTLPDRVSIPSISSSSSSSISSKGGVGGNDEQFSEVIKAYEAQFGPIANQTTADSIADWCREKGETAVLQALEKAKQNGARSFAYVEAILRSDDKPNRDDLPTIHDISKLIGTYGRDRYSAMKKKAPPETLEILDKMGNWVDLCNMTPRDLEFSYKSAVKK